MRAPSPIARVAYHGVTFVVLLAGLHQIVVWLSAGAIALGAAP